MIDCLLTSFIPLLLLIVTVWGCKKNEEGSDFMSKNYTNVLKACCCIIVIMVHVPAARGNMVQDALGSFAFVCVTFFFLFSAYGMNLSVKKNPSYVNGFWKNRLAALLIPCVVINVFEFFISTTIVGFESSVKFLYEINNYVLVLLQYCFLFWLVQLGRKYYQEKTANVLLISIVFLSSILLYLLTYSEDSSKSGWCFERMGLVWGILAFSFFPLLKNFVKFSFKSVAIVGMLCLLLGVAYLKYKYVYFYGEYLLKIVLGVVIVLFVFMLTSRLTLGNKIILFLGDISYEVYLTHGFIMYVLSRLFPSLTSGVFVVLTVAATILFSSIIHMVDKPMVKWCRNYQLKS
ncbi:MAG: acyltransferase [Paludibacteraceae bacterium]|nr:acyltransferase [Paludibacteraceae bacterium]